MPTDDIIIRLFLIVDERLGNCKKRADAQLYVSEIVTIGLLFALKGKRFSAFYRWLWANYRHWFPNLPEHSRLSRLLSDYSELADEFLGLLHLNFGQELCSPPTQERKPYKNGTACPTIECDSSEDVKSFAEWRSSFTSFRQSSLALAKYASFQCEFRCDGPSTSPRSPDR